MLRISESGPPCTVIVTVDAQRDVLPELEAHARLGLERFPEFPGFLGGALHRSADGTRLVQYLQWASQAEYEACLTHPRWEEMETTQRFMTHVNAGRARMSAQIFAVIATSETRT